MTCSSRNMPPLAYTAAASTVSVMAVESLRHFTVQGRHFIGTESNFNQPILLVLCMRTMGIRTSQQGSMCKVTPGGVDQCQSSFTQTKMSLKCGAASATSSFNYCLATTIHRSFSQTIHDHRVALVVQHHTCSCLICFSHRKLE